MKTHSEIHDLIQTCDLYPSEDSLRRILNILDHLNDRLAQMESEIERLKRPPASDVDMR